MICRSDILLTGLVPIETNYDTTVEQTPLSFEQTPLSLEQTRNDISLTQTSNDIDHNRVVNETSSALPDENNHATRHD